ncbi:ABC transporter permease [Halomonas sp. ND22Bw]|uniref:ABC transporter permease n=1 Tax=Halomonas salina TaxID=42565 RepID=A0ABR4WW88_9GAMM|nr:MULTISPECIES: ABC transporter permease [Halomonas]KGE79007.1 ABC transporter permease [Halomonas salina]PSJ23469.1 ABC transporter permease [Halomonas sp. ND22Bw]RAH36632.1 ABC transporter permease [Halomonas sp. SL1]
MTTSTSSAASSSTASRWERFRDSYLLYSFLRDPIAQVSLAVFILMVACAALAPWLAPMNPYDLAQIDILASELPPFWVDGSDPAYTMGTDAQGRDLLSTILYGLRVSLIIGFGAVALQATLGVCFGLLAGYLGGRVDAFLMRMADIQLSFSTLMVAIVVGALFKAIFGGATFSTYAVPLLVLIIGLAEWPQYARTVRASVLAEKGKEYVDAARVMGLPSRRIMFRHILPNTLSPIFVISTVQVANAIISEAALSFLGLGMPETQPSLGSLIKSGFDYIQSGSWWITLIPGLVLVVLVLVINLLGDWLRDVLNPRLYKG